MQNQQYPISTGPSQTQVHREALQRQTQQDWANREYIELIGGSIKRIAGMSKLKLFFLENT